MAEPQAGENAALSLHQLIGAPLHALIEAESQAAQATAEFIERVGFRKAPNTPAQTEVSPATAQPPATNLAGELGDVRMVTFRYERPDASGASKTFRIDVPLLSLVPIPALQIKDAQLDFFAKIVDIDRRRSTLSTPAPQQNRDVGNPLAVASDIVDFKAVLGRGQPERGGRQRSLEMLIKVKVSVEQADVPTGLARLFNLMAETIAAREEQDEQAHG